MRVLFLALLAITLAACDPGDTPVMEDDTPVMEDEATSDDIGTLLATLPDWRQTFAGFRDRRDFGEADLDAFEKLARDLSVYSIDELAAGFTAAIEADPDGPISMTLANGFVLIRVMFEVPSPFPLSQIEVPNPYVGLTLGREVPVDFPLAWPVTVTPDGELAAIAPHAGLSGGPHQLVDELRWFGEVFERRAWAD